MPDTFLEAQWRKLAMANFAVDKKVLIPYLPYKTELDLWRDRCYISLVGFMFLDTRIKGFRIPFHVNFEEVNLRFYVRHNDGKEWKRGVVFIKEIVPWPALTFVANRVYKENYETMPMLSNRQVDGDNLTVEYKWKKKKWNSFSVNCGSNSTVIAEGSEEEFITEHYWGYTRVNEQRTSEYRVEHPRWEVYPTRDYSIDVDFSDVYGRNFDFLRTQHPDSVFLAEGSEIRVKSGRIL